MPADSQPTYQPVHNPATGQFASELTPESIAQRQLQAYQMRLAGATYENIGRALGVDRKTAGRDVKAVHDQLLSEAYEDLGQMRSQSAARLDIALFALMPAVKKGDLKAIRTLTLLEKRRAELLGLDAPRKFEHTGENGGPIETTGTINIREQWSPQEAAEKARELTRRLDVISRETQRQAEERRKAERN